MIQLDQTLCGEAVFVLLRNQNNFFNVMGKTLKENILNLERNSSWFSEQT